MPETGDAVVVSPPDERPLTCCISVGPRSQVSLHDMISYTLPSKGSGLESGNLIFIEDLKNIVQYSDDDTRLKPSVCHVIAFVRAHDGRTDMS